MKVVQIRETLDKETYEEHEPEWSDYRMYLGFEPLPKTWEAFKQKMGWRDED